MCSKGTAAFPCFKRILVVNSALGFGVPPGIRGGSVGDEPKSCENVKAGKSVQGAAAKKRRPEAPQGDARAAGPHASIPAWSGVLAQNARQLKR